MQKNRIEFAFFLLLDKHPKQVEDFFSFVIYFTANHDFLFSFIIQSQLLETKWVFKRQEVQMCCLKGTCPGLKSSKNR